MNLAAAIARFPAMAAITAFLDSVAVICPLFS
jgi:hypothetical protein